jgi:lipopolysaccharide/colanic/teichoic acid biosynthesis glycosyltransferase
MVSSRDEERQALLRNTEKRSHRSHQFFVAVAALLVISSVGVVVSLLHQDASGTNLFFMQWNPDAHTLHR